VGDYHYDGEDFQGDAEIVFPLGDDFDERGKTFWFLYLLILIFIFEYVI